MFGISWGVLPPPSGIDELDIPQPPGQQAVGAPSTSPDATNLPYERPMDVSDAPKLSYQVEKLPPEATRFTADGAPRKVVSRLFRKCHRCSKEKKSQAVSGPVMKKQKRSRKDAQCPFVREYVVYEDEVDQVYIYEHIGHMGHTPGSAEDMQYLVIDEEFEEQVLEVRIYLWRHFYLALFFLFRTYYFNLLLYTLISHYIIFQLQFLF